ncbi:WD-40 repeat protein [Calothrix sp. NIES-4071]|nr:WD-40 repeat protein [Calothrix sp. NIES-4071]BAZ58144.1 WD-40 repeat protein [Calothrix sp. NIES-4105]
MTSTATKDFDQKFTGTLSDYITSVRWAPVGSTLAVVSAAGEVALWQNDKLEILQAATSKSVDCVGFSHDGKFLAAGGQDGRVQIWDLNENNIVATLENAPAWVDKLVWNPISNQLAFCLNRYIQIWDASKNEVVATLNFQDSSPLGLGWSSNGKNLAAGGNQGVKVWNCENWDEEPYIWEMPTVSVALAWSKDGKFLASGNMDRSVGVMEWGNSEPWLMRGFPGKIRSCAWSDINTLCGTPLLATSSVEGMVVWEKVEDESTGWEARVLTNHVDIIQGIEFAPNSFLLASAASDGWLCLWKGAKQVSQVLTTEGGFSSLAWHPEGRYLAAGGDNGKVIIWSKSSRGKGFGK